MPGDTRRRVAAVPVVTEAVDGVLVVTVGRVVDAGSTAVAVAPYGRHLSAVIRVLTQRVQALPGEELFTCKHDRYVSIIAILCESNNKAGLGKRLTTEKRLREIIIKEYSETTTRLLN